MPASRVLPTREAADLLRLVREFADKELAPRATEAEADETFPRELFKKLENLGISLSAVTDQLQKDAVASFTKSFKDLLASIEHKRQQ